MKVQAIGIWLFLAAILTADQIVLKNGDRVTGSIVKKDGDTITIKTVQFGVVSAKWDQVESISADTPVNIELNDGQTMQGVLTPSDGKVEVKSGAAARAVPLSDLKTLRDATEQRTYERLLKPRWIDLWTLNGSVNVAGASGNARTFTVLIPMTASRLTRTDETGVHFSLIRSSALVNGVTETTARAIRSGWFYNRNLHPRVFLNLFNDYEYDRFQNLDLRIVLGSGIGVNVWKGENSRFDLVGGFAWNRESFDPARPDQPFVRNSLEGYWGDNLLLKLNSRATLTQSYRMFNTITHSGGTQSSGYRQNFDLNLTTKLTNWLSWNAAITDRYLQHPVPGRKKNDLVYATGLGFIISR